MLRRASLCLVGSLVACAGDDGSGGADTDAATEGAATTQSDPADDTAGEAVSYSQDVRAIFGQHGCAICHHDNSAINIDIADPFSAPNGLVGSTNTWAVAHPEGNTPMLNVVPGDPDASFLFDKVATPYAFEVGVAGAPMPLNLEPLTDQERADLRAWIDAGAADDAMFEDLIRPIFGDETTLGGRSGKCTWCHHSFEGGQRPNLTDPFDPDTGAVGVASLFDPERMVIAPGNADDSVLVLKVEATEPGPLGSPMPQQFEPLDADQIATVRSWVEAGAEND